MSEEHFKKLENMYHSAPVNKQYDPIIDVKNAEAMIQFDVKESYFHAAGAVHGYLYFKALDDATFFAANSLADDVFVLTTNFNIHLERPVSDGYIRGTGRVVANQSKQIIAEGTAHDADGNEIARGTGTFVKSNIELTADLGYE